MTPRTRTPAELKVDEIWAALGGPDDTDPTRAPKIAAALYMALQLETNPSERFVLLRALEDAQRLYQ